MPEDPLSRVSHLQTHMMALMSDDLDMMLKAMWQGVMMSEGWVACSQTMTPSHVMQTTYTDIARCWGACTQVMMRNCHLQTTNHVDTNHSETVSMTSPRFTIYILYKEAPTNLSHVDKHKLPCKRRSDPIDLHNRYKTIWSLKKVTQQSN